MATGQNGQAMPTRFNLTDMLADDKPVSEVLCEDYDKLNAVWREAEKQLAALHAPVSCDVGYHKINHADYRDPEANYEYHHLCWAKIGRDWRICFGTCDDQYPYVEDHRPILDCTADIRVAAVEAFPKLREKLTEEAKKYVAKVREATSKLAATLQQQ